MEALRLLGCYMLGFYFEPIQFGLENMHFVLPGSTPLSINVILASGMNLQLFGLTRERYMCVPTWYFYFRVWRTIPWVIIMIPAILFFSNNECFNDTAIIWMNQFNSAVQNTIL